MARHPDIQRVLLSERVLRQRVRELGRRISRDYAGRDILVVAVLRGGVIFLADLIRTLSVPCALDFMAVSSYEGTTSTGAARLTLDLNKNPEGKHILLVEDVADTGLTLARLRRILKARRVASLRTCALLDKPSGRRVPLKLDYVGFRLPPGFVVGYGLDYEEKYRNLPYVGLLKPSVYKRKATSK